MPVDVPAKDMEIFETGAQDIGLFAKSLGLMERSFRDAMKRALDKSSLLVQREAIRNAPRGPTQSIKNRLKKTTRKGKRKARATSRAKPGGLEKSIDRRVYPESFNAEVFVASNSPAAKYAVRIHDEKGTSWKQRGPGTIAKGARADEKFIERALVDSAARIEREIENVIKAFTG